MADVDHTKPVRVQLSRKKGWRMPSNTVKVDRTTKWGNPFIVGEHGTRAECVYWFKIMLTGWISLGFGKNKDGVFLADEQLAYYKMARRDRRHLRGKNLACWCSLGATCHADVLLEMANQ